MNTFPSLPFKWKILLITLASSCAALLLGVTGFVFADLLQFRRAMPRDLDILARIIGGNGRAPHAFKDAKFARETLLASLSAHPRVTRAALYDGDGEVVAVYSREGDFGANPLLPPRGGYEFKHARLDLFHVVYGGTDEGAESLGTVYLQSDLEDFESRLRTYGGVTVGVLLLAMSVSLGVGLWLQRFVARPVEALAETAREVVHKNNYELRARKFALDEMGSLTETFNQMVSHIQTQDEDLRESRLRYEVAVLGSSDGLWDWDLKTDEVFFSPRWKSMLGYEESEIQNDSASFLHLIHPEDMARVKSAIDAYLRGRMTSYAEEFRLAHKNGGYRWILSRGAAFRDADGSPYRFAGSNTDITERKHAEEEILAARTKFETLVNSINGIVWEADPRTFQILFVSDQAQPMLGYPTSRWLRDVRFWESCLHPEDREEAMAARRRGIAAGKPYQMEYRAAAADGRVLWLRESVSVLMEQGIPVRLRGVAIDITEQKLAGEQITRMQQELVDTSRLAGMAEVATGVLHNVGNVLNSVNVSAALVVDQLRKSKTESLAKAVKMLREHEEDAGEFLSKDPKGKQLPVFLEVVAEHLVKEQALLVRETRILQENIEHIKQIVAMQQSYAKVSGTMEKLAVEQLMEDALRISVAGLAKQGIEVVREYEPVAEVVADRHKVLQILVNLVSNAKQALQGRTEGRRLELRIAESEEGRVSVDVKDNGVGIEKGNLTKIFNHGFTTKRNGHGFGLHSGANAAKEMGGSLKAMSDGPGKGATFRLELPINGSAGPESRPGLEAGKEVLITAG